MLKKLLHDEREIGDVYCGENARLYGEAFNDKVRAHLQADPQVFERDTWTDTSKSYLVRVESVIGGSVTDFLDSCPRNPQQKHHVKTATER